MGQLQEKVCSKADSTACNLINKDCDERGSVHIVKSVGEGALFCGPQGTNDSTCCINGFTTTCCSFKKQK